MSDKFKPFILERLFDVKNTVKKFNANSVTIVESQIGAHPYVVRTSENNGQRGFLIEDEQYLNPPNTFSFGQDTATVFYQTVPYFTGDKIKVLVPLFEVSEEIAMYVLAVIRKAFSSFAWGQNSYNEKIIKNMVLFFPVKQKDSQLIKDSTNKWHDEGYIPDWDYMAERIRELEAERIRELEAYLTVTGLKDYELTREDKNILGGG